jgi:hypothetical protein
MRRDNTPNPKLAKQVARQKYAERQIDRFVKWSVDNKGYVRYRDIVELHDKFNIKIYG